MIKIKEGLFFLILKHLFGFGLKLLFISIFLLYYADKYKKILFVYR